MSEKTGITPGPWATTHQASPKPFGVHIVYTTGPLGGMIIASLDDLQGPDAARANAKAISALPELIGALRDVSGLLSRYASGPDSRLTTSEVSQVNERLDQARAALAKAGQ